MATTRVPFTLPKEYEYDGIVMPGFFTCKETLDVLKEGGGPVFDVLLATPARTGTAWLVEILWLIQNECDIQQAKQIRATERCSFLETCCPVFKTSYTGSAIDAKLAKTHLPYSLVGKLADRDVKVVVGLRNPKDTVVSQYYFYRMNKALGPFRGTFDEFFEIFKAKHLAFGDIFDFSLGWWAHRNRENIHLCFYEDLSAKPFEEVIKIAKFLGKELSKEQVESIVQWTSFANMKQQDSTNYEYVKVFDSTVSPYMRRGAVGDWKNTMTEEQSQYIDCRYKDSCFSVGLTFTFE